MSSEGLGLVSFFPFSFWWGTASAIAQHLLPEAIVSTCLMVGPALFFLPMNNWLAMLKLAGPSFLVKIMFVFLDSVVELFHTILEAVCDQESHKQVCFYTQS